MLTIAKIDINDLELLILAVAVHNGHDLRSDLFNLSALDHSERLREEDPFTGQWTSVSANRIIADTSRFEVDLNRPNHTAVYTNPQDTWNLNLWNIEPGVDMINGSLANYDDFYAKLQDIYTGFRNLSSLIFTLIIIKGTGPMGRRLIRAWIRK